MKNLKNHIKNQNLIRNIKKVQRHMMKIQKKNLSKKKNIKK